MTEPWYPFFVGDYARKTAHLSLLEHGAYRLLIDHYISTKHPLPNEQAKLFRICRARTPSERQAVLSVTAEFFTEDGSLLRNEKCDSVIEKQLKYKDSQSAKAKKRHSHGNAAGMLRARKPEPEPEEGNAKASPSRAGPFQVVYEKGIELFPNLAAANTSAIHSWLTAGCDPDLDILPELERSSHSGLQPRSWSYFTQSVSDAMATRTNPLPEGKPRQRFGVTAFDQQAALRERHAKPSQDS